MRSAGRESAKGTPEKARTDKANKKVVPSNAEGTKSARVRDKVEGKKGIEGSRGDVRQMRTSWLGGWERTAGMGSGKKLTKGPGKKTQGVPTFTSEKSHWGRDSRRRTRGGVIPTSYTIRERRDTKKDGL